MQLIKYYAISETGEKSPYYDNIDNAYQAGEKLFGKYRVMMRRSRLDEIMTLDEYNNRISSAFNMQKETGKSRYNCLVIIFGIEIADLIMEKLIAKECLHGGKISAYE